MEFKDLKTDALTLMATVVLGEASERSPALAGALRRIEIVKDGVYGEGRPDVHLLVALGPKLEVAVTSRFHDKRRLDSSLIDDGRSLVDAAKSVLKDRENIADIVRETRSALSREIAKAKRRGLTYRMVAMSLTPIAAGRHDLPAVAITLERLGPLLSPETVTFDVETSEDVQRTFAEMREQQERRQAQRNYLKASGADILIDPVTLAALKDARIDPSEAVRLLKAESFPIIDLSTRHGKLVLHVNDGVVTGNVPLGDGMRWKNGWLWAPETSALARAGAVGKSLIDLLPHPYLSADLEVTSAGKMADQAYFVVAPAPVALRLDKLRRAA